MALTINQFFEKCFIRNEQREEKWTDEALLEWIKTRYPKAAVKSVDDIRFRRRIYNNGSGPFKTVGPAGKTADRPLSYAYDENGNRLPLKESMGGRRERRGGISEDRVREIAREEAANASINEDRVRSIVQSTMRPSVTVVVPEKSTVTMDGETLHKAFEKTLRKVMAGVPVLLVGPAGSGKTTLARQIAEALGRRFTFNSMSEGISESHLLGRKLPNDDGSWRYEPAPFVVSYTEGGVHLLDEIDSSDPNLLVQINAAIANGRLSIPFARPEPFDRHKDSIIIAAANTFGNGADRQYVGRNQLDAATLDRFRMGTVEVDYDRDLEERLVGEMLEADVAAALLKWAHGVRDRIAGARLRRIMSTRVILDCAKLLAAGETFDEVRNTYFLGWSSDEKAKVQ